ncbi:MAG: serine/threonine-protein kinase, partial [Actinomycetota bacterium]
MADTRSPTTIGRYRIVAPIGVGSSSTVYRVVHDGDGSEAALKVLADNHSLVAEMRQRFLDEAALLSAVDHPGLAQVYAVGETERGQPYLALELAERGDLRRRVEDLSADGHLVEVDELLALGAQLAAALDALHEAGIVHRDVTPGNILIRGDTTIAAGTGSEPGVLGGGRSGRLLRPDERILIADLGLAKDLVFASGLTAGGGTRGFAAPEQQGAVTVVDHRVDIYGATAVIRWVAERSSGFEELQSFLATGLADDPEDRHQSMTSWLEALEAALGDGTGRDRPRNPRVARTAAPRWRRLGLGLGLGLGAVLAVAGLATQLDRVEPTLAPDGAAPPGGAASGETGAGTTIAVSASGSSTAEPDAEPTSPSTTDPSATASTPTSAATTVSTSSTETTTVSVTSVAPQDPTTTDPRFLGSPRAYVVAPADGAIVTGDLTVEG